MATAFRFIALCLALFWLPATAHCQIETLGFEMVSCAGDCHEDKSDAPAKDGCDVVEDGLYKSSSSSPNVAPAVVAVCACLLCLSAPGPDPDAGASIAAEKARRPRHWIASWRFVQRVAPPARAPASVLA